MSKSFKDICYKIFHPSIHQILTFYFVFIVSIISSVIVIVNNLYAKWFAIIIFTFTFIALCYAIYLLYLFYKFTKSKIKVKIQDNRTWHFISSYNFRSIMSALLAFIINVVFAVFLGSLAIMSGSIWYGSLTIYYIILSINRGSLVLRYSIAHTSKMSHVEIQLNKAKTYRNCGILILFLTLALAVFVVEMIVSPESMIYADILIYPVAIFTVYKVAGSIINIFKAKKHDDTVVQASRNLNLASATMSLLTLQVSAFQLFLPNRNMAVYNGVLGGFSICFVIVLGIYMIINGNRKINNFYDITR